MELHAVADALDQLSMEVKALRVLVRGHEISTEDPIDAHLTGWRQGHAEAELDTAVLALVNARSWIAAEAKELDRHVPGEGPGGEVVRIDGSRGD